ncbi:nitroreductase/quinone reductase family protein [Nocardia sp. NBC_01327]|uniref:nitroreductase/quinone reductase family protein n=1 Tax=Nocardia sp. NBC_01327 TaxID=2903593 RepID=UPI002E0D9FC2|nr:nitroreductase family deazaflavin-dependent oxidoreductase [Nocardia sp. NBC_01327]
MTTTSTPPTVPGYVNWVVKRILRSPLHRVMSRNTMLLYFTGRKTGKQYTAVVRYVREGDLVSCYTDSKWWINLRGGAPVELLIGGRTVSGTATVVKDLALVTASLTSFLEATPGDSKYYGVGRDADGRPKAEDIRSAAEITTLVQIAL